MDILSLWGSKWEPAGSVGGSARILVSASSLTLDDPGKGSADLRDALAGLEMFQRQVAKCRRGVACAVVAAHRAAGLTWVPQTEKWVAQKA